MKEQEFKKYVKDNFQTGLSIKTNWEVIADNLDLDYDDEDYGAWYDMVIEENTEPGIRKFVKELEGLPLEEITKRLNDRFGEGKWNWADL